MSEYKKEKRKAFMLSFVITFLVMAVIIAVAVLTVQKNFIKLSESNTEFYIPVKQDDMTVLVCGKDDGGNGVIFALIGFYPENGTMPVTVFPPETLVQKVKITDTLSGVYKSGGASLLKQTLEQTTGLTINRWVEVDKKGFIEMMTILGPADYNLKEPLEIDGVSFSKGIQQIDGEKATSLILHRGKEESPEKAGNRAADVISGIINDRMKATAGNEVIFKKLKNVVQTDISLTDFLQRKNGLKFLGKLAYEPAYPVAVGGTLNEDRNYFALSKETVQKLTKEYK